MYNSYELDITCVLLVMQAWANNRTMRIVCFVHACFLYMEAGNWDGDVYMFKKLFGQLQRIGKALMLPVAILPAAGIFISVW